MSHSKCREFCPDGHPCTLDGDVPHTLHVCHTPQCVCHSRTRYEHGWAVNPAPWKPSQSQNMMYAKPKGLR